MILNLYGILHKEHKLAKQCKSSITLLIFPFILTYENFIILNQIQNIHLYLHLNLKLNLEHNDMG